MTLKAKYPILPLVLFLLMATASKAQDTVRLELVPTLNGDTVRLQLLASRFIDVDQFSLGINFDRTDLQFVRGQVHSGLQVLNEIKDSAWLGMSWTNPNSLPLTLQDNSVLAEFSFYVLRRNVQTCFDFGPPARPAAFFTILSVPIPVVATGACSHLFGGNVSGLLSLDLNQDCASTPDEPPAAYQVIRFSNGVSEYLAITGEDGRYSRYLPYGNYNITVGNTPLTQSCTGLQPVVLNDRNAGFDYSPSIEAGIRCPLLQVEFNAALLEWCTTANATLRYFNYGTDKAENAYILLDLDPSVLVEQSSKPYTLAGPGRLRFDLGTVDMQSGGQIGLRLRTGCNTDLQNRTMQGVARIFPADFCSVSPRYSGADLEVTASCINNESVFEIRNTGTGDMKSEIVFNTVEDDIMPNFGGKIKLGKGASEMIRYPADGKSRIIIVDTLPGHPYQVRASAGIEGCGTRPDGRVSKGYLNNYAQGDEAPSRSRYSVELRINPLVPLQIAPLPEGAGSQHYIAGDDRINYTFMVQNTGSAAAHRVVVRNILPATLDLATLQIARSGQLTEWSIVGDRTLELVFDRLNLPPAAEDALASRIYFSYSVRPMPELTANTVINNSAEVLMDNGIRYLSATVKHTIGKFIFTLVQDEEGAAVPVIASPNPTDGTVRFSMPAEGDYALSLFDMDGRLVFSRPFYGKHFSTDALASASAGLYAYIIRKDGRRVASGKIVKKNTD